MMEGLLNFVQTHTVGWVWTKARQSPPNPRIAEYVILTHCSITSLMNYSVAKRITVYELHIVHAFVS